METIRVLYIEDDDKQRKELTRLLRLKGFSITTAISGKTGLSFFKSREFDVILCDLNMPDMNGLEVLKRIRKKNQNIPFILLTAHGTESLAIKAIKKSADYFILKPASIDQIIIIIRQTYEKVRLEQKLKDSQAALRLVSENVPDVIYSLSPEGKFTSLSPAIEACLDYKPSELLGTSVFNIIFPDDRERVLASFMKSIKTGEAKVKTLRFRMISKTGEVKHFEISRKLIFAKGQVVRSDGIARDISERIEVENKLKEYSRQLEEKVAERTKSLEYTNQQLAALNKASAIFSKILDEKKLFKEIPKMLTSTLDFDRAYLLVEDENRLLVKSWCCKSRYQKQIENYIKKINRGLVELPPYFKQSFKQKKTIFVCDLTTDNKWPKKPTFFTKAKSMVISPIKVKAKVVGVIAGFMDKPDHSMDQQDIQRFVTFANIVGLTLDNVWSYKSLEKKVVERTKSLKAANDQLQDKTKVIQKSQIELAMANIELLGAQEQLQEKNQEMEELLKELSKNREGLQTIINSTPHAIMLVDNDSIVRVINKSMIDYFDLSPNDIIDRSFNEFSQKIKGFLNDPDKFQNLLNHLEKTPDTVDRLDMADIFKRGIKIKSEIPIILSPTSLSVLDKDNNETGRVWDFVNITKAKQADEQIQVIVKASPIPTIISRIDNGKIIFANEQLASLVKLTTEELIGRYTPDFYYDSEDRKKVVEALKRDGHIDNFEVRLKKADGSVFWSIFSLVITEIGGEPVILGGIYDISERKQAEEALAKERNFVSAVLDTAGALVLVLDKEGRIVRFNKASQDITGYSYGEMKGTYFWEKLLIPEELDEVKEVFKSLKAGNFPNAHENCFLTKDGSKRIIAWSNTALTDDSGSVEYVITTGIDITERKRVEEALRVSEERFRGLVENANDIIYSLTSKGRFSYISPKFTNILGYEVSEYIGKSLLTIMHPDDKRRSLEWVQSGFRNEEKRIGYEFRLKHKDGSIRWFVSNSSVIFDENGKVVEIMGVAHDITQMKKVLDDLEMANQHLKDTQSQLAQSEKMASLGMLVAGIAHEINTPIGAVNSMHDTLIRSVEKLKNIIVSQLPDKIQEQPDLKGVIKIIDDSNKVIKEGSDRVINIVKRLRSFARLDEAELKEVDIHEGLEDTLTLIHHDLKHGITVIKNFGDVPPVACYPGQLNQVFLNILINAKQAMKGKGEIKITTYVDENNVFIEFADNGIGIPEGQLRKIFDPGFTTKGVGVGTGLGLSICYQIIQDHQGEITVESELNKGTTFTIILPINLNKSLETNDKRS